MSQVVDTFIGIFVMVLMMLFGTSIVSAQISTADARSYKNEVVAELENSNYNPLVINECIQRAGENGYGTEITLYREGKSGKTYTSGNVALDDTVDVIAADVQLSYQYKLTFLGNSKTHYVRGFAR